MATHTTLSLLGCVLVALVLVLIGHHKCQDIKGASPGSGNIAHPEQETTNISVTTTEQPPLTRREGPHDGQSRFFHLIDFGSFKQRFRKHYSTITEELARQKLFLARYFKAKLSRMVFNLRLSRIYLGINRMSDWTQRERDSLKNRLDSAQVNTATTEQPQIGGEQLKRRKRRSVDVSADNFSLDSGATVQPMTEAEARQINALDDMDALDKGLSKISKLLKRITGGGGGGGGGRVSDGSKKQTNPLEDDDGDGGGGDDDSSPLAKVDTRRKGAPIDLRLTGCFNGVRHQGACGSCYAFAALAQYEFMYCLAYGKRIRFSEQFIVDCGPTNLGMAGCEGGTAEQVAEFAHLLGMEKLDTYHYTATQNECPYQGNNLDEAGYVKTKTPNTIKAHISKWDHWLKKKVPLYVSFGTDDSTFFDYAGGIDRPATCDTDGHAMLLVGTGSDKVGQYFILRNSLGFEWGHSGYYYVYKDANCWLKGANGWAPEGLKNMGKRAFIQNKEQGDDVDGEEVRPEDRQQTVVVVDPSPEPEPWAPPPQPELEPWVLPQPSDPEPWVPPPYEPQPYSSYNNYAGLNDGPAQVNPHHYRDYFERYNYGGSDDWPTQTNYGDYFQRYNYGGHSYGH